MTDPAMNDDLALLRDPATDEGCLSDFALDRAVAGEALDEAQLTHLAACDRCAARRVELAKERDAFVPPELPATPPVTAPAPAPLRLVSAGVGVLLAAAAAVVILVGLPDAPVVDPGVRTKGDVALGLFVKRGDVVTLGGPGEVVHPGDELRFTMRLAKPARVAVLSLDGAGVASVYFPSSGPMPEVRETGRDVPLELSTELDDTLGVERLYGLACAAPIDLSVVRAALARDGTLTPPAGCTVDQLEVVKR
jgi:hypothetical protein